MSGEEHHVRVHGYGLMYAVDDKRLKIEEEDMEDAISHATELAASR